MSVSGLKVLEVLKNIIGQKEGFLLGTPWRYSKKSLGVVVPILRTKSPKRNYKILEEVKDKVDIKDTGRIDRAKISSKVDKAVFIRLGTVFEGSTQERAVQHSTIIMPKATEVMIPIKCVHASKGIVGGTKIRTSNMSAPREVKCSLSSGRSQNTVWKKVSNCTMKYRCISMGKRSLSGYAHLSSGSGYPSREALRSDDLVGTMKKISGGKNRVNDIIKEVPLVEMQVGVAILDQSGVVCLECFNANKSWKAFHESVMRENADVLAMEQGGNGDVLFSFNKEAIPSVLNKFLEKMLGIEEKDVWKGRESRVTTFKNKKVVGEYSIIDNEWVYLFASRNDDKNEPERDFVYRNVPRRRRQSRRGGLDWSNHTPMPIVKTSGLKMRYGGKEVYKKRYKTTVPLHKGYETTISLYSKDKITDIHPSKFKKFKKIKIR